MYKKKVKNSKDRNINFGEIHVFLPAKDGKSMKHSLYKRFVLSYKHFLF